jgi:Cu(I)/Ag(I) efflux system membrane fusion protein
MNKTIVVTALLAACLGLAGGYLLALQPSNNTPTPAVQAEKKPVLYRSPMNPEVTSPVPAKDQMGMDYVPVYDQTLSGVKTESVANNSTEKVEKKILHYRHPMGLPDISPVPKKDSMGMDYTPVYEEVSGDTANILRVSTEKIQRLGVKTALVETTEIEQTVRSIGSVEVDERRMANVTIRFDGFIEKLYVNVTGQPVTRGQPLFELHSPDLISAQHEYLLARSGQTSLGNSVAWLQSGMKNMMESSLERLRNWGISESELVHLEQTGKVHHALVVRSPASGIVMEKTAVSGARAMAGDTLFKIADLSQVWIIAEVYEQDIGLVKLGQTALATLDAYPDRIFKGKVGFIYPTLNPATRTIKVRVELPNPDELLKPMMYARLEIATQVHRGLTVPKSAVLESGRRTLVLVDRGEGRFEPRPVKLGLRGEEMTEVLKGLQEHERVVDSANFLIDAESNLKAALGGFGEANLNKDEGCGELCEPHQLRDDAVPSSPHPTSSSPVGEHNQQRGK